MIKPIRQIQPTWVAAILYAGLAGIFYAPLLLGWRAFPDGDFTHHFLHFSLFQQNEWLAGRFLPVWNPYTYSGHPFLADVQSALFYPLGDLLLLITLPFSSPAARLYFLQLEAVIHIALAGFFTFLLVREISGSQRGALLSGVLFAFSGYLTGYPPLQLAILRTVIWLPLILWLLTRAFADPHRWRPWIVAILAYAAALLAGHPQSFLHVSYVVLAWVGFLFFTQRRSEETKKGELRDRVMGVFAFCLLPFALTAAQWLPSLEFTNYSVRARVDYAFVSGGFPLRDTWQMLFPGILTQFSPLYIGVVGVMLAMTALLGIERGQTADRRRQTTDRRLQTADERSLDPQTPVPSPQSPIPFFTALTLLALLLSYGGNGFLYPIFYRFAPGWDLFRGQERAAFLVAFGLSVLAGMGMAALPSLSMRRRRIVGSLGAGIALLGAGIVFGILHQRGDMVIGDGAFAGIILISLGFAVAVAMILWLPGWDRRRSAILIGLAFANLLWANFATNLDAFGPARKTILAPEMEALQRAVLADPSSPGRVYNEYRVYENYGMRLGVEDVWGSSPLRSGRYAALFENFPLDRLWQLTGVTHVLTWRRELFGPSELLAEFPQAADTTYLHRLPDPQPRAWIVPAVRIEDDATALALLADSAFDLSAVAILAPEESDFEIGSELQLAPPGNAQIDVARPIPNRLRIDAESAHGGLLVISETWLPGWRIENARCEDGPCALASAPLRANLTLLGVILPAGIVSFDLVYWPDSLRLGLAVSLLSAVMLLAILYWRRMR
ncbi:MAG: hypothetical protein KF893_00695 [Caldilineaceae bacterium]|nr:hypothetical protein [Caldilineaceae bacterium]